MEADLLKFRFERQAVECLSIVANSLEAADIFLFLQNLLTHQPAVTRTEGSAGRGTLTFCMLGSLE